MHLNVHVVILISTFLVVCYQSAYNNLPQMEYKNGEDDDGEVRYSLEMVGSPSGRAV